MERILNVSPKKGEYKEATENTITGEFTHVEYGHLLIQVHRLRSVAHAVPVDIRGEFFEDIRDLENKELDRDQKLTLIDRLWKILSIME